MQEGRGSLKNANAINRAAPTGNKTVQCVVVVAFGFPSLSLSRATRREPLMAALAERHHPPLPSQWRRLVRDHPRANVQRARGPAVPWCSPWPIESSVAPSSVHLRLRYLRASISAGRLAPSRLISCPRGQHGYGIAVGRCERAYGSPGLAPRTAVVAYDCFGRSSCNTYPTRGKGSAAGRSDLDGAAREP